MPIARTARDETLHAAWRRVLRLWRPLALWTVLVWVVVGSVLAPVSSALLGWGLLRGRGAVVGNEALLLWLVSPAGLVWGLLAGGLALLAGVVRYAGIFHLVTVDLEGSRPSVAGAVRRLAPQVPALFRLALVAVAAGVLLVLPLLAGLAVIRWVLLSHDINYYLAERPGAWQAAIAAGAAWTVAWLGLAAFVAGRTLLALPAYLDGHRPLRVALARARARGVGQKPRLFRLLTAAVGLWLLLRLAANAAYFAAGTFGLGLVAAASGSVRPIVWTAGAYAAGQLVLDAVIAFLGFSFVAVLLTKFYYEDTDLHTAAPPGPWLRTLPAEVAARARGWLRPGRVIPGVAGILLLGAAASAAVLAALPEPRPVVVTAHRAGPPPAPENTLAALERAIAAGADYAEIDVQRTRDGVVVVVHDADLMRMAGDPRRIRSTDYGDLSGVVQRPDDGSPPAERRVARLDELLERARGRIGLNIELKYYGPDPQLAGAVVREVRRTGMADEVVVMSLSADGVRQVARLAPELVTGYVASATVGDPMSLPVRFLAVPRQRVTARLLRTARARGLDVHAWTVNRADHMAGLIEQGVDGLITDDPALAVRVAAEMAELSPVGRLLLRVAPRVDAGGPAGRDQEAGAR